MMILTVILVLGGYALYSLKPEERTRLKERLVETASRARGEAARRQAEPEPFRDALRERTPWPLVMPGLLALNVLVFLAMGWGGDDAETLVSWGASFGPRTTNGEWWRLVASMFVHTGTFQLLVNGVALVQLGLILERLVGHATFAAVYFAAGLLASIVACRTIRLASAAARPARSSACTGSSWRLRPGLPSCAPPPRGLSRSRPRGRRSGSASCPRRTSRTPRPHQGRNRRRAQTAARGGGHHADGRAAPGPHRGDFSSLQPRVRHLGIWRRSRRVRRRLHLRHRADLRGQLCGPLPCRAWR